MSVRLGHRVRRDERGMSLMELVVVVLILGIVTSVLFNFLDNTLTVTTRATSSVVKENEGRQALRELTQDIRAANKISTTAPTGDPACASATIPTYPASYKTCLRFEVQRSVVSTQVCPKSVITYGLATTGGVVNLRKSRTDYAGDCTTKTSEVQGRLMVTEVNNGATPLFEYFDAANQPITTTDVAQKERYVKAQSVRINLILKYKSNAPDIKLTSAVALRNNR